MLLFLAVFACGQEPAVPQSETILSGSVDDEKSMPLWKDTLGPAEFVAAADFNGDGVDERVWAHENRLHWPGGVEDIKGKLQVACRGDLGEGERVFLGIGMGRNHREAPAQILEVGPNGPQVLWSQNGPRNQITDLRVVDGKLFSVRFVGNKTTESAFWENGEWRVVHKDGLATQQIPLEQGVLVGRVYGAQPRSDGDLRWVAGGKERFLPSLRGVRSLLLAQLDSDDEMELLVGDGWHYAYGERAVGRVQLLDGPDWKDSRTIAHLSDEYSARSIEVAPSVGTNGAGQAGILISGTKRVHYLKRDALGWRDWVVGPTTETSNAVLIQTPRGLAAWIAGPTESLLVGLESR
jgi:hypothetical protein